MAMQLTRRRFTVDEYHRMAEAGILGEDDRVELIEGEIVEMAPIGGPHRASVDRLNMLFAPRLAGRAIVAVQNPIRPGEYSEPQPDVVVLRLQSDFYRSGHPTPDDILLLVEVADTTVGFDRGVKVPLYARCGVPEMWLVDLAEETITVYRDPTSDGYRVARVARRGEHLSPAAFPDLAIGVAELLG